MAVGLLAGASKGLAQEAVASGPAIVLRVEGMVERPLTLSAEDLARMPRQTVEAKGHEGKPSRFTGVALGEVLKAGSPMDPQLAHAHAYML